MNAINNDILKEFAPVKLKEMDNVALLNRIDTKYVLHAKNLNKLLIELSKDYLILEIQNKRNFNYNTLYYDTPESDMFLTHMRGKLNRYKVRKRTYVESNKTFLEVKFKNNKQRTIKWRTPISNGMLNSSFLTKHIPYNPEILAPTVHNKFKRLTLVDKNFTHRATIDSELTFDNYNTENPQEFKMQDIAIIEIKTSRDFKKNSIHETLKSLGIPQNGFSKYCMGRVFIDPHINKSNALKPKILNINKITQC